MDGRSVVALKSVNLPQVFFILSEDSLLLLVNAFRNTRRRRTIFKVRPHDVTLSPIGSLPRRCPLDESNLANRCQETANQDKTTEPFTHLRTLLPGSVEHLTNRHRIRSANESLETAWTLTLRFSGRNLGSRGHHPLLPPRFSLPGRMMCPVFVRIEAVTRRRATTQAAASPISSEADPGSGTTGGGGMVAPKLFRHEK